MDVRRAGKRKKGNKRDWNFICFAGHSTAEICSCVWRARAVNDVGLGIHEFLGDEIWILWSVSPNELGFNQVTIVQKLVK